VLKLSVFLCHSERRRRVGICSFLAAAWYIGITLRSTDCTPRVLLRAARAGRHADVPLLTMTVVVGSLLHLSGFPRHHKERSDVTIRLPAAAGRNEDTKKQKEAAEYYSRGCKTVNGAYRFRYAPFLGAPFGRAVTAGDGEGLAFSGRCYFFGIVMFARSVLAALGYLSHRERQGLIAPHTKRCMEASVYRPLASFLNTAPKQMCPWAECRTVPADCGACRLHSPWAVRNEPRFCPAACG